MSKPFQANKLKSSFDKAAGYWIPGSIFLVPFVLLLFGLTDGFWIILILLLLASFFSLAYAPYKLTVDGDHFIMHRIFGSIKIPLAEIVDYERVHYSTLFRVIGVGGLFGYLGEWSSSEYGSLKMYAKRKDHLFVLFTKANGRIVISLDDIYDINYVHKKPV